MQFFLVWSLTFVFSSSSFDYMTLKDLINKGFTKVSYSQPKKLCIQWNRGHCTFDTKCRFAHEEMVACNFAEGCSRMECKFWHAASTGKFPFLEHGRRQV